MKRILVISDIHGEFDKFEQLLEKVQYKPEEDQLLLAGDYVDRGPNSKAVVEKVQALVAEGAIALMGNHEKMMLEAFYDEETYLPRWLRNGASETLRTYGYTVIYKEEKGVLKGSVDGEWKNDLSVQEAIAFMEELLPYYETEDYIFVHAGVHPTTPLAETDLHTLVWIREVFHQGYTGVKPVIFGHTPTKNLHSSYEVYFGTNNIIGIDGGLVYGGRLNCLELPSKTVQYVE
ncbi:metallophosphoesterase family protein [Priestia taiwanensis]|uniref:Serine/threonine protein phosphatase n=1 Tax=Priestia taiwanensis TaxID=1347902 RepID=A0A917AK63_9BACI|nr:metallophosphoesterase family protein [Priestia taiwanensis]MBM7361780.1 serine/threonine protein phosphatase 1 [Priestia taiwanensis]GGE56937.1 serine/threonine protein phosphatase [Priestia taiwanensis]